MKVLVVSTHRSDKAHYAPLLRLLRADSRFDVTLYAVNDAYKTPDYIEAVRPLAVTRHALAAPQYDAGVVLGDRYEMLLAAAQLVEARIPLLHIHGGEHTYGSLDERWRYAISMIADVHCVATVDACSDLRNVLISKAVWTHGMPDPRVVVTGAPGLDDIHDRQPFPNAPRIVVLYNPAIDEETTKREWNAILDATMTWDFNCGIQYVAPNGDRFSDLIGSDPKWTFDSEKFRDLLAAAHVIVGNSSAGIIEAPSLGTWTVNVGERQAGRPRAKSVRDAGQWSDSRYWIQGAIEYALEHPKPTNVANPYGDGHASPRIRDVLLGMA